MPMPTVKHIVVLMLENRGFDHMLGYLQSPTYEINGIDPSDIPTNPMGPHDPTPVPATNDAPDKLPFDAGHSITDTNIQLFFNLSGPSSGLNNKGFVYNYSQQANVTGETAPLIMKCFDPKTIPVLTTLAQQFALCINWYSSVPGPTWPNRFFVHCATSKGFIDNLDHPTLNMRTIFENLSDVGETWKIYSHDFPQAQVLNGIDLPEFNDNWDSFGGFKEDCRDNTLPSYGFIEPMYGTLGGEANDQHPPHSVQAGEQLIADTYNAIRNSSAWNDTLLIVLYDEHGGTFDHVLPPAGPPYAIPPDDHTTLFGFDRLGVRVPAILISPYIAPLTIVSDVFDHTSIPAMIKKTFGLPKYLTKRDAAANTFEGAFNRGTPRTDAPTNLEPATLGSQQATDEWGDEITTPGQLKARAAMGLTSSAPVSDLQKSLVEWARSTSSQPQDRVTLLDHARTINTEHDASVYLRQAAERIRQARSARKR
jgi:phospholipase C